MRKYQIIYGLIAILSLFFTSCDPIVSNDGSLGDLLTADQLSLDVHATTDGGNQIVMINNTPNTAGMWKTGIGTSTSQNDTILLPFLGENKIYFYATSAGGIVEDSTTINISTIDHALSPIWTYFAGTGSKTWVWATDLPADWIPQGNPAGACYGVGGSYVMNVGSWWPGGGTPAQLEADGVANDSIKFDLNGGANFTLYTGNTQTNSDGSSIGLPAGTHHGTFKFDMTKTIASQNAPGATGGDLWSIGKLDLTGVTVSLGTQPNNDNIPVYSYNILYLDDNVMILAAPQPDGEFAWGGCWFWIFKRKGYTFPAN